MVGPGQRLTFRRSVEGVVAGFVLVVAFIALASACSHGRPASGDGSPKLTASGGQAPRTPATPSAGPAITLADATAHLPMEREGRRLWPVGAVGEEILFEASREVRPAAGEPVEQGASSFDQAFLLWNPVAGSFRPAWTNAGRFRQQVVAVDGDWAVILSAHLNLVQWRLSLRNVRTGEEREIAAEAPGLAGLDGIADAMPAISDGRVVFVRRFVDGSGEPVRRLDLYDVATGRLTTLAGGLIGSPSVARGRVAWVRHAAPGSAAAIVVRDLASGSEATVRPALAPSWCVLSPDGRFLAWDEYGGYQSQGATWPKLAMELSTGKVVRFAEDDSAGAVVSGRFLAWRPSATPAARAGFYDLGSNEVRRLAPGVRAFDQASGLVGKWFCWSERVTDPETGTDDPRRSTFHFMPLP